MEKITVLGVAGIIIFTILFSFYPGNPYEIIEKISMSIFVMVMIVAGIKELTKKWNE